MKKLACLLAFIFLASGPVAHADAFQKVKCGSDIPKALIGQHASNDRVAVLEQKSRALGLKDLGADEISDRLSSVNWQICGAEFILLIGRSKFSVPRCAAVAGAFQALTGLRGHLPGQGPGSSPMSSSPSWMARPRQEYFPVQAAWKIDQQQAEVRQGLHRRPGLPAKRNATSVDGGP